MPGSSRNSRWHKWASGSANQLFWAGSATDKLLLLRDYLDAGTYSNFSANGSGNLKTDDMQKIDKSLGFTAWSSSNYPRVEMQ